MNTLQKMAMGLVALVMLFGTAACGTMSNARQEAPQPQEERVDYVVYRYPGGLPGVENSMPARWSAVERQQVLYLDRSCRTQSADQLPSSMRTIAQMGIESAVLNGLGLAAGALLGFPGINAFDYFKYGAGAGLGSGVFAGMDRAEVQKKLANAICMAGFTYIAQTQDGALPGIVIAPVYGRGQARLPAATDPVSAPQPPRRNASAPPPPPPPPFQ